MSNKSIAWTIVAVAVGFVAASGLSSSAPVARGGQEIPPGGRPGKIRSYYVSTTTETTLTVIPSVEGANGFVITDVVATIQNSGGQRLTLAQTVDGNPQVRAQLLVAGDDTSNRGFPHSYHFGSGVVLTPGSDLKATTSSTTWWITVSGYTY